MDLGFETGLPRPNWSAWLQAIGAATTILLAVADNRRRNRNRRSLPEVRRARFAAMLHRELAATRHRSEIMAWEQVAPDEEPGEVDNPFGPDRSSNMLFELEQGIVQPIRGLLSLPLDAWPDSELAVSFWGACGPSLSYAEALEAILREPETASVDAALRISNVNALLTLLQAALTDAWTPIFDRCEEELTRAGTLGLSTSYFEDRPGGDRLAWASEEPDEDQRCRTMHLSLRLASGSKSSRAGAWWRSLRR